MRFQGKKRIFVGPALALMSADNPFGWMDSVADELQWMFQSTKWKMLKEGKRYEY